MKITYQIQEPENRPDKIVRRVGLWLEVSFDGNIEDTFKEPEFVLPKQTIPVILFQHPDDTITLATERKVHFNGKDHEVRAFRLRLAPVKSFSKNAFLQLYFPGKVLLGYVDKSERKKAEAWLQSLVEEAQGLIAKYVANREATFADVSPITIAVSNEIEGVESKTATASRLLPD